MACGACGEGPGPAGPLSDANVCHRTARVLRDHGGRCSRRSWCAVPVGANSEGRAEPRKHPGGVEASGRPGRERPPPIDNGCGGSLESHRRYDTGWHDCVPGIEIKTPIRCSTLKRESDQTTAWVLGPARDAVTGLAPSAQRSTPSSTQAAHVVSALRADVSSGLPER